ncbi:MAG: hypothetical protein KF799_09705 [Bdellovibrionales bacterium]|nr:hypothetical protein [Bdellovibrionales bacterium]
MWWRVFIPSWRFFDRPGVGARLWAREHGTEEWLELLQPPPRNWRHLLLNPQGNLYHARQNLLERLALELDPQADAANLVSYRLTQNLVREELIARGCAASRDFEFKLVVEDEDILRGVSQGGHT